MSQVDAPDPRSGPRETASTAGGNRLLAALAASDLSLIEPHLRDVQLTSGDVLFEPGDEVHTTFFPCGQTIASLLVGARGEAFVEAANIGREGAIGGIVSAGFRPAFGRSVVLTSGSALAIDTDRLEDAKRRSHDFRDLFSRYADALLAQVMQSVACNASHTVEQRCCRWLLSVNDRAGDLAFELTQEALAQKLGVQRTTISPVAAELQASGAIRYSRGRVAVLDRALLLRSACPCYEHVERHYARLMPEVDSVAEPAPAPEG